MKHGAVVWRWLRYVCLCATTKTCLLVFGKVIVYAPRVATIEFD